MGLLSLQPNTGSQALPQEGREMFRQAVARYQIFVVPHCTPFVVQAYAEARAERDRLFVQSLRGTELEADYLQAVADEAKLDNQRVYECMGPPLPPPPKKDQLLHQSKPEPPREDMWVSHTREGDKQFAVMVRLRDQLLTHPRQ
jgi:hypothetical protein